MTDTLIASDAKKQPRTTGELELALRHKYGGEEWALFFQVRDATGFQGSRTADALAMGLWPSRGLELHGFEIKAFRGDWLRELKKPSKAEEISSYCDRWWIVAGDKELVKPHELPPTWGLMTPHGDGLRIAVPAPKLTPATIDRLFLAALLRRAALHSPSAEAIKAATEAGRKEGLTQRDFNTQHERDEHKRLQEQVKKFKETSGVEIDRWRGGDIGAAVKFVCEGGVQHAQRELKDMERSARQLASHLQAVLKKHKIDPQQFKLSGQE